MDIAQITNLIMSIVPSLTAVLVSVSSIILSIYKIRAVINDSKNTNADLRNDMRALMIENAELKHELKKTVNRLNHVIEVDTDVKEG